MTAAHALARRAGRRYHDDPEFRARVDAAVEASGVYRPGDRGAKLAAVAVKLLEEDGQ